MEPREHDEMELDLRELFQMLKKRIGLIIIITILTTLTSGIVSFFVMTPIYEASTEILVNKSENEQGVMYTINDINTDLKLISTYSVIIKSPRIIDIVIKDYDLPFTADQLNNKISINTVRDSQVMKITVVDEDPANAAFLANVVAFTFQKEISKIMRVDNVQILTEATVLENPSPVKPNKMLNVAIAFVLGLMISVGLALLLEYLDTSIKTEEDVEKLLGYPVLGAIGTIEKAKGQRKKKPIKTASPYVTKRGEFHEV